MLHSPRGIETDAPPAPAGGGVCGLCYEDAMAPVTTACGHGFCKECMQNYVEALAAEARAACPTCHASLSVDMHAAIDGADGGYGAGGAASAGAGGGSGRGKRKGILSKVDLSLFQSSTKIEARDRQIELASPRTHPPNATIPPALPSPHPPTHPPIRHCSRSCTSCKRRTRLPRPSSSHSSSPCSTSSSTGCRRYSHSK